MRTFSTTALLLASVAATPAFAQAQSADSPDSVAAAEQPGDIIVTAQKRDQKQIDVPLSLTAVTGKQLDTLGVSDLDEVSWYVPGLNIQEQSANNPGIVIRGITSDSGSAQESARVTLYYNGVDISRSRGAYQDLYDIERIEVVKGPQATLFGTASEIGAISIISAKPKAGLDSELTGGYGNYDSYLASGHINYGSDVLAGRLAFAYKKRNGYVRNIAGDRNVPNQSPTGTDQDDLNGQNQLGLRASLRYQPSDRLTVDAIFTYDRQRNPGTAFISRRLPTTAGPADPFGTAELGGSPLSASVLGDSKLGLKRHVYDGNLTIKWDFADDWSLTFINAYRKFDAREVFDADGSAAWYLEFAENARGSQFNNETRFSYTTDTFRGSFGFNFFHEKGFQEVPFSTEEGTYIQCTLGVIPGLGCVAPNGVVTAAQATALLTRGAATQIPYASLFRNEGNNDSYSVFADATYIPTPRLELTVGVRGLIEKRRSGYFAAQPNSVLSGAPLLPIVDTGGRTFRSEDSFAVALPRFNALYRFGSGLNGFVTVSKGRRSPIVQLSSAAGPVPSIRNIPPETVWNFEGGLKASKGIFTGSLGVYYQVYNDFQVSQIINGRAVTANAGSAKNFGVEGEGRVQATRAISVFGNFNYIDAKIDSSAANGTFAGQRFRLQPKWQASGGITFDAPLTERVAIFATPSVTYRSTLYFEVPNSELISQGPVALVNLKAGVRFADRYELSFQAHNLLNRRYLLDAGNTGGGFGYPSFIPAEPRLYQVQLSAKF